MGSYQVKATAEGFAPGLINIEADRTVISNVNFELENLSDAMQAVQIVANVAKDRRTPIAYSNISGKDIKERL